MSVAVMPNLSHVTEAAAAADEEARKRREQLSGVGSGLVDLRPPSDGAALLDDVGAFLRRFVAYPSAHAYIAHTLWIAHAHLMDAWESTPRIAFLSPEPGSGKTRALEISELLVPRSIEAINATPAYLFRKVSDPEGLPTILFDEIDTLFGAKAKEHEEIRGILNAGHRRGAKAGRCVVVGKTVKTEELPAYCAVALAGLGNLPDTILTRSVIVRMRRRAPTETVEPYRRRVHVAAGHALRDRLASWAIGIAASIVGTYPQMPDGVEDRAADVWEPLLAVADAAGGDWPAQARAAAVTFVTAARENPPSLGVRLLADLRIVFGDRSGMTTMNIIEMLVALDEAPWADLRGQPIDPRKLANYLRPYGVESRKIRIGSGSVRGYRREDLHDSWSRYLPPLAPPASGTSGTDGTAHTERGASGADAASDTWNIRNASGTESLGDCPDVPDVPDVPHPAGPTGADVEVI